MNKRPIVASPPWTAEDDNKLREFAAAGERVIEIAQELQRSEAAVRNRFYKLGLPLTGRRVRRARSEEQSFANHHERQFMEYLRGVGWVNERMLPPTKLVTALLNKGWIERRHQDNQAFLRMTEIDLAALKAPVPIQKSWSDGNE